MRTKIIINCTEIVSTFIIKFFGSEFSLSMDVVLYLEVVQAKLGPVSAKINKLLSKIVKAGAGESSLLLQEDTTTNLLPGEEVQISSNRIYTRSILTVRSSL